jgi:hypothetical protein
MGENVEALLAATMMKFSITRSAAAAKLRNEEPVKLDAAFDRDRAEQLHRLDELAALRTRGR